MKTTLLILLSTWIFALNAQDYKFMAGIEAGPNYSTLRGNDVIRELHKPLVRYSGGMFIQWNFHEHYSVRTGYLFEEKGSSVDIVLTDNIGTTIGTVRIFNRFQYVTLPLLFRATFGNRVGFFVNGGPGLSILMKAIPPFQQAGMPDVTKNFNKFDVTLLAGAGLNIGLGKTGVLSFELRNNLGLTNISNLPVANNASIKTNSTMLLVGIAKKFVANKD
jgi:hypothetical protein